MIRQFELVERVRAYDPEVDEDALNRAYVFSMKAHGSQTRASGDPYFSHPLEVAGILTRYRLDGASIVTALLHDTLEDTNVTFGDLNRSFGEEVAQLVDGVTKLSLLELQSEAKQAENFRKLVLAMSRDIRVLLVKLADRLHNMRTLSHIKSTDKRRRISRETMDIYAPLAERIGMNDIKDELQDLSFQELNPDARDSVLKRLGFLREKGGESLIGRILEVLETTLAQGGVTAALSGREKTPYSVWRKMQHQQVGFEALSDIMAFRAVVGTAAECYQALGLFHGCYPLIPGRFKDYISTPKQNGYRSLHTGVVGPEGQRIEVQIRTREMHDIAERGVAAHWQYHEGGQHPTDGRQYRWLQELLEILDSAAGPEEFLEHTKLEMFHDQVFCFSPKGDVYALPQGATSIDFAYAVHSEVGDHCVGAKVNGSIVPLRVALQNGDQVEILTSSKQTPSPEWEQIVVTGKARSRIRRFVQREQQEQYVNLGRNILEKAAAKAKRDLTDEALGKALEPLHCGTIAEIYARVGEGLVTAREVIDLALPESKRLIPSLGLGRRPRPKARGGGEHAVAIRGLIPGMALHLAKCCYPLPGDRIVGIVTTGKGVTVHTIDCDTLANFSDSPERWLDVAWDVDNAQGGTQVSRLLAVLINEPGSLGELASVIATHEGNISNLKFTNRTSDFFDMMVDVEVRDAKHLATIVGALRAAPAIVSVSRARQ